MNYLETLKEEKTIPVKTSWCVDDVRSELGDKVKHMTDDEIFEELGNCANGFHEMAIQSGWDVINFAFNIKENQNA
jgi:hypothetical protein